MTAQKASRSEMGGFSIIPCRLTEEIRAVSENVFHELGRVLAIQVKKRSVTQEVGRVDVLGFESDAVVPLSDDAAGKGQRERCEASEK